MPALRLPRLRLLPSIIFVAVLMLGVRVGNFWATLSDLSAGQTVAAQQAQPAPVASAVPAAQPAAPAPEASPAPAAAPAAEAAAPVQVADLPASEAALGADLAARRTALDQREQAVAQQEALLAAAEQQVNDKVAELQQLRTEIQGMLTQVDDQREAQIAGLVKIYENMRPADAGTIFDGLEMDVLIDVLQRMRETKAAPILASMTPDKARAVTTELAQRRNAAQQSLAAAGENAQAAAQ